MKVTVFDAMMGSGKTTKMINIMHKSDPRSRLMYITPLLSECHRIAGTLYDKDDPYQRPLVSMEGDNELEYHYDWDNCLANRRFQHPSNIKGKTKLESIDYLIESGCNIVSTHSLFTNFTPEIINKIKEQNYILFLDEVISVYEIAAEYTPNEIKDLLKSNILSMGEDQITLKFNREKFEFTENTKYKELANLCDLNQLLLVDGKVVIWEFPIPILAAFKEVYISTYMFGSSQMGAFLKANDVDITIEKFGLKPSSFAPLIDIVEDRKMNVSGIGYYSLSKSSTLKGGDNEDLRKSLNTFFVSRNKTKKEDRLWTSFKDSRKFLSAGNYTNSWLAYNTKSTNDYGQTWAVAYMLNLFLNPMVKKILSHRGVEIVDAEYALSEMVQFIWRSRIRNNEPIKLFIPSERMRNLLKQWLNDEFE